MTHHLPPAPRHQQNQCQPQNNTPPTIHPTRTHHPPPASRATACGVDGGWNDDKGDGRQEEREMKGEGEGDDEGDGTGDDSIPPTPSLMSNCSWGGSRVEQRRGRGVHTDQQGTVRGDKRGPQGRADDERTCPCHLAC
ncbi:hypothetical protein L208DRAFT_814711 [Tricholoma matsutake]|nr:hypothetical protein L208DRAFT_814711 [Tricholoma matsutake 945]